MKALLMLIVGIAIGVALAWYLETNRTRPAGGATENTTRSAGDTVDEKLHSLKLSGADIKEELAKTGRVIRQKAGELGQKISDATADSRATAAIKAKFVKDPDLSAWDISVNTTDGVVTLSGTAHSEDDIAKAITLAMDTDGVRQVISTLQVKPK